MSRRNTIVPKAASRNVSRWSPLHLYAQRPAGPPALDLLFSYTGAPQRWTAEYTRTVVITCVGGAGGLGAADSQGGGGSIRIHLDVEAGEEYDVIVGNVGQDGGFDGGGYGGCGGGGTGVRDVGTSNPIVIAGGGGGGSISGEGPYPGGNGGHSEGPNGGTTVTFFGAYGTGATDTTVGLPVSNREDGEPGSGNHGGDANHSNGYGAGQSITYGYGTGGRGGKRIGDAGGAGGGGGWYGGGGGGTGSGGRGGPGGGGSSHYDEGNADISTIVRGPVPLHYSAGYVTITSI
jgi:hypothetical protein